MFAPALIISLAMLGLSLVSAQQPITTSSVVSLFLPRMGMAIGREPFVASIMGNVSYLSLEKKRGGYILLASKS
jgi:energy-converting hydrogenase Eha subunit A